MIIPGMIPKLTVAAAILYGLFLWGCGEPIEVDRKQQLATRGSIIDLTELQRLGNPDRERIAESCRLALQNSTKVLRSFQFLETEGFEGWVPAKNTPQAELTSGILRSGAGDDFQISLEPDFECSRTQQVLIRARRLKAARGGKIRLQWIDSPNETYTGEKSISCPLRREDRFHVYTIEVGDHPDWPGEKVSLRLDFLNIEGGIEIDAVTFEEGLSSEEEAMLRIECGIGGATLAINNETRPAMHTPPGEPSSIPVVLPEGNPSGTDPGNGPVLVFATGISRQGWVHGGNPVRFRIFAESGRSRGQDMVFDKTFDPVHNPHDRIWHDYEISLGRYAGEEVHLTFSTENIESHDSQGSGAFAVWAHPLIHCPAFPLPTNVLVILVDTLRSDHLSCYGYPDRTTPHLDRWAGKGFCFKEVVSSSSWTAPAIASLFTGQHPFRHGVRSKHALDLGEDVDTLTECFLGNGYVTGAISDNVLIIPDNGYAQGFHTFLAHPWNRTERGAREVTDLAIAWLERNRGRPFFYYLHYMDPHGSYNPEAPYDPGPPRKPGTIRDFVEKGICGEVTRRIRSDPTFKLSNIEQRRLLDLYDGEIASADYHIGRLLAWLGQSGLIDRTSVVILADHGEGFGEHGFYDHMHTLHDEEVCIPLLILPPPGLHLDQGVRHSGIVRMVDLAPTILELSGLEFAVEKAGRSLVPVMERKELPAVGVHAYSERATESGPYIFLRVESALRSRSRKIIFNPWRQDYRMFDLDNDPGELEDMANAEDRITRNMMTRLDRYLSEAAESQEERDVRNQDLEAVQLRQLEALGYLDK